MKQTHKHMTLGMSLGMSLGMCFGVSIGVALGNSLFDSTSTGMCLGLCFGMAVGMMIGALRDREINRQIEEKGYTVREITPQESGDSLVTLADKNGEPRTITATASELKDEQIHVGCVVFVDETNHMEVVIAAGDI